MLRGTYRVLEILERGGMGVVYRGEHLRLKRNLAIKVLAEHLLGDEKALDRFCNEAHLVSRLEHPNVVQVLDFDVTEEGQPYLVMELLHGETLARCLEREGQLSATRVCHLVRQAGSALAAAHREGIVHRDVKPANVFLVDVVRQDSFVKLLDFGISRRVASGRRVTTAGELLGTPEYMAPEQAIGDHDQVGPPSDQYALATIAYEALTGLKPFGGSNVLEVLQAVVRDSPLLASLVAPSVSLPAAKILDRGMAKKPADRFGTVEEFVEALAHALNNQVLSISRSRANTEANAAPDCASASEDMQRLVAMIACIQDRVAVRDMARACVSAEAAADIVERTNDPSLCAVLNLHAALIESIFEARIGPLDRVVRRRGASEIVPDGSPRTAFLLSRLEEPMTIRDLLDVAGMPRLPALRCLLALVRSRMIEPLTDVVSSKKSVRMGHGGDAFATPAPPSLGGKRSRFGYSA